jgi:hypothetical protein
MMVVVVCGVGFFVLGRSLRCSWVCGMITLDGGGIVRFGLRCCAACTRVRPSGTLYRSFFCGAVWVFGP